VEEIPIKESIVAESVLRKVQKILLLDEEKCDDINKILVRRKTFENS